jgi:protein-disulfide isomerase
VAVYLKPPPVFRVDVGIDGAPSRGPASAPVTVVEFSDFHCPFCREAENTLAQVQSRFPDKVRLIFRDFPIDQLHPRARPAHEAARCAGEQGKFWEYHNALFVGSAKSPDQLTRIAQDVGLNAAPFDQCVTSGKYRAAVQKDIDEGTRLGVTGTPSFFINGRMLTGAQPIETFVGVIENELSRAAQQSAAPR